MNTPDHNYTTLLPLIPYGWRWEFGLLVPVAPLPREAWLLKDKSGVLDRERKVSSETKGATDGK